MADINVPLLVALGDRAAPQHKVRGQEAFEFAEGSDGALHTKIVDQNGNPISSSNKLQVADTDVKAELEQIKQQQQQILQRLNQPIDTQLTGSIVELFEVDNILIPAHSAVYVTSSMKYPTTNFAVAFRFNPQTLSGGYLLKFFERVGPVNMATEFNIVDGDELKTYRGTASFESVIPEGNIRVDNLTDEDITLAHIKVWGIL